MKGLKLEPGCRQAWVTWLNLFALKSKPPARARMEPLAGSSATRAASTLGTCAMLQAPFSAGLEAYRPRPGEWPGRGSTGRPGPGRRTSGLRRRPSRRSPRLMTADDLRGRGLDHDRGHQVARPVRGPGRASSTASSISGPGRGRQAHVALRAAVAVATVVVEDPLAQAGVGRLLVLAGGSSSRPGCRSRRPIRRTARRPPPAPFRPRSRPCRRKCLALVRVQPQRLGQRLLVVLRREASPPRSCGAGRSAGAAGPASGSRRGSAGRAPGAAPPASPPPPA